MCSAYWKRQNVSLQYCVNSKRLSTKDLSGVKKLSPCSSAASGGRSKLFSSDFIYYTRWHQFLLEGVLVTVRYRDCPAVHVTAGFSRSLTVVSRAAIRVAWFHAVYSMPRASGSRATQTPRPRRPSNVLAVRMIVTISSFSRLEVLGWSEGERDALYFDRIIRPVCLSVRVEVCAMTR